MAKLNEPYRHIEVESYEAAKTSGLHGVVHVRPLHGGPYPTHLRVECPKEMVRNFPVGTRFRVKVKLTDRQGSGDFLYSHHSWAYEVLEKPKDGPCP
ncbi:MAG: hypothetical protein EOS51_15610 [Mesorhizobium sp.]|nr:MAG: hypothetical protein EOS51_15610 [Mesorhizobium sp.]TGT93895.1 hypothetical protein EN807_26985 [Mesorhizobium sp. M5C.F.Ca.ET.164.01.1.1]